MPYYGVEAMSENKRRAGKTEHVRNHDKSGKAHENRRGKNDRMSKQIKLFIGVIIVLVLICGAIVCLLLFTNEWKHKALRYIYTSTCSAGLLLLFFPLGVFASGIIGHIAILSRSLSDMYVAVISSVLSDLIVISIVLLVISIAIVVVHGRARRKASI